MPEDGFDFHAPARREAKHFEPPPWEREAFEELERKRAEKAAVEAAAQPVQPATGEPGAPVGAQAAGPAPTEAVDEAQRQPPAERANGIDETRVAEMLAELSKEEPASYEGLWKAAIAAAIVLGAVGAVLVVWSMAAFVGARRSGPVGVTGGAILLLFGAGFVAAAWWLTVRTLRQRGVL